jgi:sec-independent protein translocase protein TatA
MVAGYEWIIILVIVILVFGVGRISKLGSELGKGISAFREGIKEATADNKDENGSSDA